jgi:high-affinity Fe2+/Pb2+ permease
MGHFIALAFGVFIGNWLLVPLFIKDRPFKDGFWIGLIAAVLILGPAFISGLFFK